MISVIVPVYNTDNYLIECLDSIINQTYNDLEIILIDDGSTDNSSRICDEYDSKYANVRVVHKENEGVSVARNLGIEISNGEYIAFVDSDDVIDDNYFENLLTALLQTDSEISACALKREYTSTIKKQHLILSSVISFDSKEQVLESITDKQNSIEGYACNKLYKRSVLKDVRFDKNISMCEDSLFAWTVVSENVNRACFINEPMYHYRIILSSATRNSDITKYLDALKVYEYLLQDAHDKGIDKCFNALSAEYLIWNTKVCEQMFVQKKYSTDLFKTIKHNLTRYKKYITLCGTRNKVLIYAAMQGWVFFSGVCLLYESLKNIFLKLKRKK